MLEPANVKPKGGASAFGERVGASGDSLTSTRVHELHRKGGRYGIVTMCIGGGQGISMVCEAV